MPNPTPLTLPPHPAPLHSLSLSPSTFPLTTSEKSLRKHCEEHGSVLALRIFPEKGYAFIKYESHEIAARAIYSLNGQTFHGQVIKVNHVRLVAYAVNCSDSSMFWVVAVVTIETECWVWCCGYEDD